MSSWDGYGGGQIFPADILHRQDTLEAVLQQPAVAPLRAPAEEVRELMMRDAVAPVAVDIAGVHGAAAAPRRRPFRTDRHSKIRTAQGVRDRRMRLSVGVAREFFALQDRLGFDKASKTVNWLLTQSKPAIDRLHDFAGGDDPAASVLPVPAVVVKGRGGEGSSSSSTFCFEDSWEKGGRSRGGGRDGVPTAALVEEHGGGGGGELDWITSHAGVGVPFQPPQQMDELEYCYQYYMKIGEMMRCNNAGGPR